FTVLDFCNGMADIASRTFRLIGDPQERYQEDPVRMLRAARLAAKLGFTLADSTQAPLKQQAHLLSGVPTARLFEECLKLFLSGHALVSLQQLRKLSLLFQLLPQMETYNEQDWAFIEKGLERTDA